MPGTLHKELKKYFLCENSIGLGIVFIENKDQDGRKTQDRVCGLDSMVCDRSLDLV